MVFKFNNICYCKYQLLRCWLTYFSVNSNLKLSSLEFLLFIYFIYISRTVFNDIVNGKEVINVIYNIVSQ